jgi:large subunit ribosomal protein L3
MPLAFIGYKAGMTHVYLLDEDKSSPTFGKEVFAPVTIVETPPAFVAAVRLYGYDPNRGLYSMGEAWAEPPPELELHRKISTLGGFDAEEKLRRLESLLDRAVDVRIIIASQPKLAGGLEKKKPDLLEVKIGAPDVGSAFEYAASKLGDIIGVSEVISEGQLLDVIGVTKGKGFQGVIKRWGVKELPRWHKHRKGSRRIGARSHGKSTFWETPQPGQTGFHRRTEYNKLVLEVGEDGYRVTPSGGFLHYGLVRSHYVMLMGTLPGPPKRPVVLRHPVRPPPGYDPFSVRKPKIVYLSLDSKQGA